MVAFPHKQILKALKDHPEGAHPEFFNNLCGDEERECHNLLYRTL